MRLPDLDLSSPAAFLVVGALALVDGVIPLVPARTALIGIGVIAGTGDLRAYPMLAVATGAAFLSDNLSYYLGAHLWPRLAPHLLRSERARYLLNWVERELASHGTIVIGLARVIPGGPTPVTLTAGSLGFPIRRFRIASAVSAAIWSAYAFASGLIGTTVTNRPLIALLVGIALAGALTVALRLGMKFRDGPGGHLHRNYTPNGHPHHTDGVPLGSRTLAKEYQWTQSH
jgi:membrane protein DedA with SNARE-associated domain